MACLGELSEKWWLGEGALERLRTEREAHGSFAEALRIHPGSIDALQSAWSRYGGETLKGGRQTLIPTPAAAEGISELERLQQRNRELEKIVSRGRKDEILEERMVVVLRDALDELAPTYSPAVIPKPRKADQHEMALLWSDAHAGEKVSLEETNGLNEYDWKTMMRRHDEILRGVLAFKENRPYPVKKLHVWGLGDNVGGEIHQELLATNEFPIIETAVQLGLDASAWLERFVPEFESVEFAGVVGNHGRMYHKPQSKERYNNFDWLVYHTMRQRLAAYKSVKWEIPKAQKWPVMVCGRRVLLFHGDGIRSTMVDVPWGGIIRYTNKLSNQYAQAGQPIDHFVCGHWHEANAVKNRRIIVNGSVIGANEWVIDTFGSGERPAQVLLTFHPHWGLTDVSFIDLEPAQRLAA
ncbi:MAG: hypothetical protein M0R37_07740 [Bacteroidales bacterium]|nr:hypothetical protein [Bacteroidales bacterium]